MVPNIKTKGSIVNLVNNIFNREDQEQKPTIHLAYLVLIESVRILNMFKFNPTDQGFDISKPTSYITRVLSVRNSYF